MPPLRLTDDELNAIFTAAMSLAVEQRDAFLQQVAIDLQLPRNRPGGRASRLFVTFKGCTSTRPTSGRAGHPAGANCPSPNSRVRRRWPGRSPWRRRWTPRPP